MKHAVEADLAGSYLSGAGDKLNSLLDLIPRRVILISWCFLRRLDWVMSNYQRAQLNDLAMVLEKVDSELTRNVGRNSCVGRLVERLFERHAALVGLLWDFVYFAGKINKLFLVLVCS